MRRTHLSPRPAFAAAVSGLVLLSFSASAQLATGKPVAVGADAGAACERAARQALGSPAEQANVSFNGEPTVQANLSDGSQAVLRGAGRVRGTGGVRGFTYSCNVDLRTAEAVGVVVRNSASVAGSGSPARAPIEPDLSHLSPQDCESRAAGALKERWPSVSRISFDSATRRLLQDASGRAELHGQGRALPAPNSPLTHFGFDCVIDPRDGRVLSMRVSG
jgi:hypothetical protein